MASSGINQFLSLLQIDPSIFKVYYDFNNTGSGLIVPSVQNADGLYSGKLSALPDFYDMPGSGFFTGQSIQITNATGLNSSSWTMFFVYEKTGVGNGVLFSNFNGSAIKSGWAIGMNDMNRIYFESWDNNGPVIRTSKNIYGTKNGIAITHSPNNITLSYYDFNKKVLEQEQSNINSTYVLPATNWYLGGAVNAPSHFSGNNYLGYMDEFLYFNQALTPPSIRKLFSGFFTTKSPDSITTTTYYNSIVTGYATGITGISSGNITGFNVLFAGNILDSCGNSIPVYTYNNLSGILSGTVLIPLTISGAYNVTGISTGGYNIDSGYIFSFGMDGFALTRFYVTDAMTGEYYTYSQNDNIDFTNKTSTFNLDGTFKLDDFYTNNNLQFYLNGYAELGSGYSTTGTIYQNGFQLSGDYFITGQSVESSGSYQSSDIGVYDNVSGLVESFNFTGLASGGTGFFIQPTTFPASQRIYRAIFLNGVKQIFGISTISLDYSFSGSGFFFHNNINKPSGRLVIFPIASGASRTFDRSPNLLEGQRFARSASPVWINDLRARRGIDYVETSTVDYLNGSGLFYTGLSGLYTGDGMFFENL